MTWTALRNRDGTKNKYAMSKRFPKVRIAREYTFDAAHWLPKVPDGHKCKNLHGHTYRIELVVKGECQLSKGWFMDYADLDAYMTPLLEILDHNCLNEIDGLTNPTTEVLAHWILERFPVHIVDRLRVYESARSWCEVEEGWQGGGWGD